MSALSDRLTDDDVRELARLHFVARQRVAVKKAAEAKKAQRPERRKKAS